MNLLATKFMTGMWKQTWLWLSVTVFSWN